MIKIMMNRMKRMRMKGSQGEERESVIFRPRIWKGEGKGREGSKLRRSSRSSCSLRVIRSFRISQEQRMKRNF